MVTGSALKLVDGSMTPLGSGEKEVGKGSIVTRLSKNASVEARLYRDNTYLTDTQHLYLYLS